jgi:hypothetical protein
MPIAGRAPRAVQNVQRFIFMANLLCTPGWCADLSSMICRFVMERLRLGLSVTKAAFTALRFRSMAAHSIRGSNVLSKYGCPVLHLCRLDIHSLHEHRCPNRAFVYTANFSTSRVLFTKDSAHRSESRFYFNQPPRFEYRHNSETSPR